MLKSEKGFSLVELLIAVVLLTIGLLAVAGMQTTAINSNAWANRLTTAASLAQEVMENFLARNPETDPILITATNDNATYDLDPNNAGIQNPVYIKTVADVDTGVGAFTVVYTISLDTPVTNVTKIDVAVCLNILLACSTTGAPVTGQVTFTSTAYKSRVKL